MKPLSKDIRSRIIKAREAGEGTIRGLATRFKVAVTTIQRLVNLHKKTGSIEPLPRSGGNPAKIPDAELYKLKEIVAEKPDRTIKELTTEWNKKNTVQVTTSTISRSLERCNLTLKKKTFQASERDSEANKKRREDYECKLAKIPEAKRVYIDECGTNLNMTRSHSRSKIGIRAYSKRSGRKASNISLVGSIRLNQKPILYPFDGAVDGERFVFYLKEKVISTLTKGDVVIMDNCRIHYVEEISKMLTPIGVDILYLPPYSPELNPIEETWSEVKNDLKSDEPRTIPEYIDALNKANEAITFKKIKGFFNHATSFLKHMFHVSYATG